MESNPVSRVAPEETHLEVSSGAADDKDEQVCRVDDQTKFPDTDGQSEQPEGHVVIDLGREVDVSNSGVKRIKPSFRCEKCDKDFSNIGKLKIHTDAIHLGIKKNKCQQCGRAFAQLRNLKSHIDTVHLKIKNAKCENCENCDKTFRDKAMLTRHIKSVHYEFTCQYCEKSFKYKYNLTVHMNSINLLIKNVKCENCDKTFRDKGMLRRHIKSVHSKFMCQYCDKSFQDKC